MFGIFKKYQDAKKWNKLISFIKEKRKEGYASFKVITSGTEAICYIEGSDKKADEVRISEDLWLK